MIGLKLLTLDFNWSITFYVITRVIISSLACAQIYLDFHNIYLQQIKLLQKLQTMLCTQDLLQCKWCEVVVLLKTAQTDTSPNILHKTTYPN